MIIFPILFSIGFGFLLAKLFDYPDDMKYSTLIFITVWILMIFLVGGLIGTIYWIRS